VCTVSRGTWGNEASVLPPLEEESNSVSNKSSTHYRTPPDLCLGHSCPWLRNRTNGSQYRMRLRVAGE
jgi:hypothetical protein